MPTPYEKSRDENIKRNKELLLALELAELKTCVPPNAMKKYGDIPGIEVGHWWPTRYAMFELP
jgi:hypothetical protein